MRKWKKWHRALAGAVASVVLAVQMPVNGFAAQAANMADMETITDEADVLEGADEADRMEKGEETEEKSELGNETEGNVAAEGESDGQQNMSGMESAAPEESDKSDIEADSGQQGKDEEGLPENAEGEANGAIKESTNETEAVQEKEGLQTGYVNGTGNAVSWTYDPETKTTTVTGEGTRNITGSEASAFPEETEYIRFENCKMQGSLYGMFYGLTNLLSIDFAGLQMENITDMGHMFYGCSGLTSLDLGSFDTSRVTDMWGMFDGCSGLTSLDLGSFDTSQVTLMGYMFDGCSGLTSLDIGSFDTSQVTNMWCMFSGCSGLTSLDIGSFDTSRVTNMWAMFDGCSGLTSLEIGSFDTSRVADMRYMFDGCSGLTSLDIGSFDTSRVGGMERMFSGCSGLTSLELGNFDTSQVTNMERMFYGCSGLTSLDIGNFDTSQVTDMDSMFSGCSGLTRLDLDNFVINNGTTTNYMLENCTSLVAVVAPVNAGEAIALPSVKGYVWKLPDSTEVTELAAGLESAIEVSRHEVSTEEDGVIHVSTTEQLREALTSSRRIVLADGIYEMDGSLELSDLKDVVIQAENPGRAELLSHNGYAPVLRTYNCKNVEIMGCILGHSVKAELGCASGGTVISTSNSQDIGITGCDLFGCGTIGIESYDCQDIRVEGSVIRDCRYNIVSWLDNKGSIIISGCIMSGNNYAKKEETWGDSAAFSGNKGLDRFVLDNCTFLNNHNGKLGNKVLDAEISGCVFHDNAWDGQEPKEYGICLNGLTWQIEGNILKLGYPLRFEDGSMIESAQVEPLPYSDASLPWKKYSYQSVEKAWEDSAKGIPSAVKFVPYDAALANDGGEGNYVLTDGALPEGITLSAEGRISGVPKADGSFVFTVLVSRQDGSADEYRYRLEVAGNTEENFNTYADPGYELLELVPDMYLDELPEDGEQLMVSRGTFEEFVALYLDGELLTSGEDYVAVSGSTRITILNQTLKRNGTGKHTLSMEFRVIGTNVLRWAAQNFVIAEEKTDEGNGGQGDEGDNDSQEEDDVNQDNIVQDGTVQSGVTVAYKVQKGDTLWKIAGLFYGSGRYWRRIYEDNKAAISDPNSLRIGQTLTITRTEGGNSAAQSASQGSGKPGMNGSSKTYTVEAGDNLYKIALKLYGHGRYWEEIYKANQDRITEPKKIYAKQILMIP